MSECVFNQLHILDILSKAKPSQRKEILIRAEFELIKAIVECIENVLQGRVDIKKSDIDKLKKFKNVLRRVSTSGEKWKHKKKIILQQGGSFLPAILQPIVSVLSRNLYLQNEIR